MTIKVAHFVWRNGRPRWNPSPSLRSRGFKGADLKDEQGNWLALGPALAAAAAMNEAAGTTRSGFRLPKSKKASDVGWVYVVRAGDHVKIGHSVEPLKRLSSLQTGMHEDADLIFAVRGSVADERRLHDELADYRKNREWFFATAPLLARLSAIFTCGRIENHGSSEDGSHVRHATPD